MRLSLEALMSDTFVLIIGAWHGGWAFHPTAEHLRAAGKRVFAPTLPGLAEGDDPTKYTLNDCVDAIVELFEREDLHDVTLVGHSWGGYPMTGAAVRVADRLAKVIYWSAFVPTDGVSLYDEVPQAFRDLFDASAAETGNNTVRLPYGLWANGFIQDGPEDVRKLTYDLLVPHPLQYFTEPVTALAADFAVPTAYVISEQDISQPTDETGWPKYYKRLPGGGVQPTYTAGAHESCFTTPATLAQSLLEA